MSLLSGWPTLQGSRGKQTNLKSKNQIEKPINRFDFSQTLAKPKKFYGFFRFQFQFGHLKFSTVIQWLTATKTFKFFREY